MSKSQTPNMFVFPKFQTPNMYMITRHKGQRVAPLRYDPHTAMPYNALGSIPLK